MLTTTQIKSAEARERAYKLADSGGLYLLVQPNGSKLWRYKFRIGGVEGKQSLGTFPEVSLAEARGLHGDSRKLVAQGTPSHESHPWARASEGPQAQSIL
ncbi:Arm DNA-binding domain-containing protein [Ottowia sp.]|uniref:Arm DNA-binding domain-containing protein n=1 Tax=Ottowia sp. TaxID=1898956 RepID=UPI002C8CE252|nr:Arm DNA-binding domain-containing protein [Ottowia sp.]HNR82844.1 Arm DNA-binding domain-containing protein [Ottowia sp.]